MNLLAHLQTIKPELLDQIKKIDARSDELNTQALIYGLLNREKWLNKDFQSIDFLSKKIDISQKLFLSYSLKGIKTTSKILEDSNWQGAMVWLLVQAVLVEQELTIRLKRFNVLFKALDVFQVDWLKNQKGIKTGLEQSWQNLVKQLPVNSEALQATVAQIDAQHSLKEIPLTVLFYEGPIARAYLATLKNLGLRPSKIIELISSHDLISKKPIGKWMPKGLRQSYAANSQRNKIHYWSKQLTRTQASLVNKTLSQVQNQWQFSAETTTQANKLLPLSTYSDTVSSLMIENLKDDTLLNFLNKEPQGALLYTGGGIVPKKLLEITHLKFLHVHPGYLPHIRGADCTLWSNLITGHMSASCFYMILPCWLPQLQVEEKTKSLDLATLYRLVYGFIDPWVRAFVLRQVLNQHSEFENIKSDLQNVKDGLTYHFMHKNVKKTAIESLFK